MKTLENYVQLTEDDLMEVTSGIAVTILGVTYVGAKAIAILAGSGLALGGAEGWGAWVGYNEAKR